jgi:hypothetical protein
VSRQDAKTPGEKGEVFYIPLGGLAAWRPLLPGLAAFIALSLVAVAAHALLDCAGEQPYDDEREIAEYARHPPDHLIVPPNVELALALGRDPLDPRLLDVALGPDGMLVHGRELGPVQADGYMVLPLAHAVDWARKLPAAADAGTDAVNLLVDARATYEQLVPVVYTLGQREFDDMRFVVRRPDGALGVVRACLPATGSDPPDRAVVTVRGDGYEVEVLPPVGTEVREAADGPKGTPDNVRERYGAGCAPHVTGITVPRRGDVWDGEGLAACLMHLDVVFGMGATGIVRAVPSAPFQAVVTALEVLDAAAECASLGLARH